MPLSPRVSVLVAVHDEERYIPAAFQSILEQRMDFRLLEVILVDDGSRDRSGELIESYARRYENVRAFHFPEASGGAGRPWNLGLREARAPYVMFLGADDVYPPGACEALHGAVVDWGGDIVSGKYLQVGPSGSAVPSIYEMLFREPFFCGGIDEFPAFLATPPAVGTRIFRRAFLEEAGIRFPEGIVAQDAVFVAQALLRARGIGQIDQTVYEFRVRDDGANPSVSQRLTRKYFEDLSASRRAIVDLYARYSRLDYLSLRYWRDANFILSALARAFAEPGGMSPADRVAALESLRWFCALHGRAGSTEVDPTNVAIVSLVADGECARAIELLELAAEVSRLAGARRDG